MMGLKLSKRHLVLIINQTQPHSLLLYFGHGPQPVSQRNGAGVDRWFRLYWRWGGLVYSSPNALYKAFLTGTEYGS
jgi:hypothetical protein